MDNLLWLKFNVNIFYILLLVDLVVIYRVGESGFIGTVPEIYTILVVNVIG